MTAAGHFIGLMSGTSMDGIDAALVRIDAGGLRLVASHEHPWPEALQERLLKARRQPALSLRELGELETLCGEAFAQAAMEVLGAGGLSAGEIAAIGSHGQTLYHHPHPPAPFSLQIGDPSIIAQRTGITTVADFRRRDLAAGGQGAPLVPLFHREVFADPSRSRVILNIGGIANLTWLPAGEETIAGFDSGPGNCLMDQWVQRQRKEPYDAQGRWASSGRCHGKLLGRLLDDPYFGLAPPKSSGTEYFSLEWLEQRLAGFPGIGPETVQATLLELTVESIGRAIETWAPGTAEVLVCGGGCHNRRLMERLAERLAPAHLDTTARAGVPPDWLEAVAFAWLAARTLAGEPGNLPAATGARQAVVLGGIYPAGS